MALRFHMICMSMAVIAMAVIAMTAIASGPAKADWLGEQITSLSRTIRNSPQLLNSPASALPDVTISRKSVRRLAGKSVNATRQINAMISGGFSRSTKLATTGIHGVQSLVSSFQSRRPRLSLNLGYSAVGPAAALAAAIRAARKQHYPKSRPLPAHVIAILSKTMPLAALKRARYTQGDLSISLPNVVNNAQRMFAAHDHAVVVDDVIVFSKIPGATTMDELQWWAHEAHHVYQFKVWGIDKFAANYINNRQRIERRAQQVAARAVAHYRTTLRQRATMNIARR